MTGRDSNSSHGQFDRERGPFPAIFDLDFASLHFHRPFGDGKSKARSSGVPRTGCVETIKPIEHLVSVLIRNPRTRVGNS